MDTTPGSTGTISTVACCTESGNQEARAKSFRISRTDLVFLVLILLFGGSAVIFHQRTSDFWGEDVFYADAAQSLLQHGFYGVNGVPETTQPPGLAGLLAMLFSVFGYSYPVAVGAMAVCETLGFLVIYAFLRRRVSSLVAGAICVLLLSSSLYFMFATREVYACFPYFFSTMLALWSAEEYDTASTLRSRIIWGSILAVAVVASLLIATGTMALLGALAAVLIATTLTSGEHLTRPRLLKFLPILLLGLAVQGLWMHRKPAPLEWSLPGYPASYLNQLKLKSGNDPELGMAKWSDIPGRVDNNVRDESSEVLQIVLGHGIQRTRAVVFIPILLVVIGWCSSVAKSRGTDLADWYFAGYQFIYLLWPWTMETRFLFPIAPLFCFYLWQGGKALLAASKQRPRVVGAAWLGAALVCTAAEAHRSHAPAARSGGHLFDELSISLWLISAACAAWMVYTGRSIVPIEGSSSGTAGSLKQPTSAWRVSPAHLLRYAAYLIITGLVATGAVAEVHLARQNLRATELIPHPEVTGYETLFADVEAGVWLHTHTPPDAVIMARHWPAVRHYAERKLIWFAPISDPNALLQGIVRHHVNYVVVVKHRYPYYLPDDDYCFDRLQRAYSAAFGLILEQANLRIYTVDQNVARQFVQPVNSATDSVPDRK